MSTTAADERAYLQYRADREAGMSHEQIVADGVYPNAEHYALRFSLSVAAYADAMRRREPDNRGDLDTHGRPLRPGT